MTDHKKLIEEARRAAPGDDPTGLAVQVHRLADALEAATPVETGWVYRVRSLATGETWTMEDEYEARGSNGNGFEAERSRAGGPWRRVEWT